MAIFQTLCSTGPSKSVPCLAFFGIRIEIYLAFAAFSLLVGFGIGNMLVKTKKIDQKDFKKKSLLASFIVFVILILIATWFLSGTVY